MQQNENGRTISADAIDLDTFENDLKSKIKQEVTELEVLSKNKANWRPRKL